MSAPTKTDNLSFLWAAAAIIEVAANTVQKSSELDVSTIFLAQLFIDFAPTGVGVITTGPEIRIESNYKTLGSEGWRPVLQPIILATATPNSSAVDGAEAAGQTVIEEATTTGLANGQLVFFKNGTLANSEFHFVDSVAAGVSFTIRDALMNAQTGATWFNGGEFYTPIIDLGGVKRLRAVVNNNRNATARACAVRIGLVELTTVT